MDSEICVSALQHAPTSAYTILIVSRKRWANQPNAQPPNANNANPKANPNAPGGGGHKQHYRIVDFKRRKDGISGTVERIEYDPNRTAHIALVLYADGERRYIIAPKGLTAGAKVR